MSARHVLLVVQKVREREEAHPSNLVRLACELTHATECARLAAISSRLIEMQEMDVTTLATTEVMQIARERPALIEERRTLESGLPLLIDHVPDQESARARITMPGAPRYALIVVDFMAASDGMMGGKSSTGKNPKLLELLDLCAGDKPLLVGFSNQDSFRATMKAGGCDRVCPASSLSSLLRELLL